MSAAIHKMECFLLRHRWFCYVSSRIIGAIIGSGAVMWWYAL